MNAAAVSTPARVRGVVAGVDELLGRAVSMRAVALLRVLAGPAVLLHLQPFLFDAFEGRIYRSAFHEPYADWYPDVPRALYVGLLVLAAAAALAMSIGFLTRLTTATTFVIVSYNLFLSTTHFHNNRAYLVIVLGLLTVAPCGRELSLDAWIRRRRGSGELEPSGPAWPLWLLRFECATIYAASGVSKLVDRDWFGGTVTWQRVVQARDELDPLPHWAVSIVTDRGFHTVAAKVIVLTELFIAAGLWSRRTRYAAVWVAVVFHLAIEVSASVQVFSYLGIAVLIIWAVPSTRDRVLRIDLASGRHRRFRAAVRGLDWLARFRVEVAPPGSRLQVVDRDGTTILGAPAAAFALSRLPLTAWFALPVLLLPAVRRARRDGVTRSVVATGRTRSRAHMTGNETPGGSGRRPANRVWLAGLALALCLAGSFVVVAPPERCQSVSPGALRRAARASVDWFGRNQKPDGTWLYLYEAGDDSAPPDYNVVRHTGAAMGLYRAAAEGLPRALRSADRGTAWALERLLERDGWAAVEWEGQVETGATALLAAGLVFRREATADTRYDDVLGRLGRFLVAQTEPSGAVLASYDPVRGAPVAGIYSKYFTGEAYWALALLHRVFPGEGWGEAADRIGAYLATSRDEVEGHWPPIADHWAAYGLSETVDFPERGRPPLTEQEVSYARRQAELFGGQVRWISERFGPWGALVRGSHVPRGGGYGVISEALTGLWLTARAEPRLADLREPIAERAACIAGLAVNAQSDGEDAASFTRPDRVEGAWFRDGETRMDDQQHALAGLLRTIPIARAQQRSSSSGFSDPGDDPPSGWLWAAALLLALNPCRAAFAVPRAGRSPRAVAGLAAAGGMIGGLAVCAAAAAGDPLLDALDVSEPSFRIAAGTVAVLAGAGDLFRGTPAPEPALAGRRAALIPVAIPVVARPALAVMALGAGADRGVLVGVGAMAMGIALLTGLAVGWPTEGPGGRGLRWASRLLAAALVACGVILAVDGVFDV